MYLYGSEAYTKKPMKAMQDRSYPYAPLVVNLHQDFLTTVQSQTEYNPLAFFQAKLEQDKLAKYSSAYLTVNSYPESISFMQDMVDIIEATIEKGAVQHVNNQGGADSSSESDDSGSDEPPPSWMGSLFGLFDRGERPPEGAGALLSAAEQKAEEDRLAKEDAARVEASNKLKDDVAISDALKAEEESHYQASVELARRLQAEEEGKGRAGPSKSNNNDAEAAASAAEAAQIEAAKSYSIQTENARREKEQREQEAERAKAASSSSKNPQEAAAEAAFARAEAARGPPKLRGISQKHRQRQGNKPVSTKEDRENVNRALEAHAKKQSLKEAEAAAAVKAAEAYQAGSAAEAAEEADAVAAAIMQVEELKAAEAAEAAQAAAAAGPSNAAGPSGAAGPEAMDDIIDQLNALTSQLGSLPDDEYKEAAIDSIISEMARLKEKIDNL
jgi:chemotaxis protein histidine kinase CheA